MARDTEFKGVCSLTLWGASAVRSYYLKNDAKLGFLITQEVYKSKGAGEGFRRFRLGEKKKKEETKKKCFKVLKAHDLVSVQLFEKAANSRGNLSRDSLQ